MRRVGWVGSCWFEVSRWLRQAEGILVSAEEILWHDTNETAESPSMIQLKAKFQVNQGAYMSFSRLGYQLCHKLAG